MDKIGIAQLGVGYWGPNLLRNMLECDRCEVRCVVDLSETRRQFVQTSFPEVKKISDNPDDIFSDPSITAVVISTPVITHYDLVKRALEAGKHVLVEKPMATTVDEVNHIALLAQQHRLTAMVGHTFVYNPAVNYLRDLINSGELGQVRYIYSQRLNLGRIRSDCDVLWNLGPHDVSIVQYLLGDPVPLSIQRSGMDYVQRGIDDVVFVNMVYPNRVMVNFHLSWLDPNRTRTMTVVGSEKMVIYDDAREKKIAIYDKGIDRMHSLKDNMDYDRPSFEHRSGSVFEPDLVWEEPLKVEIEHFLDCIEGHTVCRTGPEHASKVVRILNECKKTVITPVSKAKTETAAPTLRT